MTQLRRTSYLIVLYSLVGGGNSFMGEQGLKNSEKGHRVLLIRGSFSLTLLYILALRSHPWRVKRQALSFLQKQKLHVNHRKMRWSLFISKFERSLFLSASQVCFVYANTLVNLSDLYITKYAIQLFASPKNSNIIWFKPFYHIFCVTGVHSGCRVPSSHYLFVGLILCQHWSALGLHDEFPSPPPPLLPRSLPSPSYILWNL